MEFYRKNGEEVRIKLLEENYIGKGSYGKTYRLEKDKSIKLYHQAKGRIDPKIFNLFKGLSLDNYSKVYDLLYQDSDIISAIIMKYYESSKENILDKSTDYIIYNFIRLHGSILRLSEEGILIPNMYYKNAVVGDIEITIIGFDTYIKSNLSKQVLKELNTKALLYMMIGLFEDGFRRKGINLEQNRMIQKDIESLFEYKSDIIKSLTKKLTRTQKPIEIIRTKKY